MPKTVIIKIENYIKFYFLVHLYILGPFFSSFDNLIYEPIESDKDLIWYNTTLEKTVENILLKVFEIYPTPESVPTWGKLSKNLMIFCFS